jgi:ribosomal protein S18 acetylase RimI-like enzyme
MNSKYNIRDATIDDIDFIVKAIIEAEKSGSDILSYSKIFNLSEEEVSKIFRLMLLEEIDGCEFSVSNYLVATFNDTVVAALCAWVEQEEAPSALIKNNLLSFFLPKESLTYANKEAKVASKLVLDHVKGALSLVIGYVDYDHRGNHLFESLTQAHLERNQGVKEICLQVMSNNYFAIKSYERIGFRTKFEVKSDDERIKLFLPYNEKILMSKSLL